MAKSQTQVVELWDGRQWLGSIANGLPTFGFRSAPSGLATRRQMRNLGLRPGEPSPYGQVVWCRGRRWAALYRIDLARPVRPLTPAKRAALAAAMRSRRTCVTCKQVKPYCVPTSTRECWECFDTNETDTAHAA